MMRGHHWNPSFFLLLFRRKRRVRLGRGLASAGPFPFREMLRKAICGVTIEAPLSPYQTIRLRRSLLGSLHLILFSISLVTCL